MKKYTFIILIALLFGCTGNQLKEVPEGVIPHARMVDILVDVHIADGLLSVKKYQIKSHEYQIEGYYQFLYEKHGYTRTEIDSSIRFYSAHPDEYSKLYDEVLEKLSTIESSIEKADSVK